MVTRRVGDGGCELGSSISMPCMVMAAFLLLLTRFYFMYRNCLEWAFLYFTNNINSNTLRAN